MSKDTKERNTLLASAFASVAAFIAGCTPGTAPAPPIPAPAAPPVARRPPAPTSPAVSGATNPRAYRSDAAKHIYSKNVGRIFHGQLPPLLYDGKGRVTATHWLRPPKHAPEVIADIERMVRQASPFPTPVRMGRVTYTDTWLWDKSGRFQLDTLTEGQL